MKNEIQKSYSRFDYSVYVRNEIKGKSIRIGFDGIYMIADVWINGIFLGTHPYGYTSFSFDITSKFNPGKQNTVAVKVRNEGRNTRSYSGSGIYRHVWITATEQLHVDQWGISITTPEVADDNAKVKVSSVKVMAGIRLIRNIIHGIHVMNFCFSNMKKSRDLCNNIIVLRVITDLPNPR